MSHESLSYLSNPLHNMTWTRYHEQDDIESYLDYLAIFYEFVEVEKIGESYEGRPMRVVKVQYLFIPSFCICSRPSLQLKSK